MAGSVELLAFVEVLGAATVPPVAVVVVGVRTAVVGVVATVGDVVVGAVPTIVPVRGTPVAVVVEPVVPMVPPVPVGSPPPKDVEEEVVAEVAATPGIQVTRVSPTRVPELVVA